MAFELLDYVIFIGMLCVSAGIGIYCRLTGGKQKTNEEFLLANRKQNPILVAISLMASFMSAISIISGAAEAYLYGTHFFTINIGNSLGILFALVLFIPIFYDLKTVSVFQYLELRFGYLTRLFASLMSTFQMLLYISIALAAPAISLQTITNLSREVSVLTTGIVCIFYAVLGGMKAIIITDVFQSIFMFASMFAIVFSGYSKIGSFSKIFSTASAHGRIDLSNFSPDLTIRHSWLSTIVGGIISGLILNGINQTQVQRYLTMKDRRAVSIAALSSAPISAALSLLVCLSGLTIFAVYADCDPLKSGKIPAGDHILPYYVIDILHGYGLKGIFAAGMFSASLSTVSPVLNSLAAVTYEDYLMPLMKNSERFKAGRNTSLYSQIFTLFYGIACIVLSLLALRQASLLQAALIVFQLVGGPMLGIFSLGMFTTTANQKGTLLGFLIGICFVAWLCLVPKPLPQKLPTSISNCSRNHLPNTKISLNATFATLSNESNPSIITYITRISYLYYGLVGFLCTFTLGYLSSLVFRNETDKVNLKLLHSAIAKPLIKKNSPTSYVEHSENSAEAVGFRLESKTSL